MSIKKLLLIAITFGIIVGGYGLYMYNLPSSDVSGRKVDVSIRADKLLSAYKGNESDANALYLNKVLLVSGTIKSIEGSSKSQNILMESGDLMSVVNCEMSVPQPGLKVGDMIEIKGQCAGYLMDVVLTKCVLK